MKCTTLCALSFAALAAIVPAARAADKATENALKAEYVKYMKAVKAKDLSTLDGMMTPDFKMTMGKQVCDRKTSMTMMKQQLDMTKSIDKWNYKFGPMTHKGNIASGIVYEDTAMTVMGQDKKLHKMTGKGSSMSTFRKIGGVWKVASVKSMSDVMTMDGKPFNPQAAMAKDHKMMGHKMKKGSM